MKWNTWNEKKEGIGMEWMKWMQWWLNGWVNEWMNEKNECMKWMERMTWHGMEWNEMKRMKRLKRLNWLKQDWNDWANETNRGNETNETQERNETNKGNEVIETNIKAMKHMKAMKQRNDRSLLRKPKKNHSEAKNPRFKNEHVQFSEIKMNDTETKAVLLQKLTERFRNQRRRNSETKLLIQKPKWPTEIPKRPLLICYTWSMTRDQPHHQTLWTTRCILSAKRDQSRHPICATAAVKNKFQTADKKGVKWYWKARLLAISQPF